MLLEWHGWGDGGRRDRGDPEEVDQLHQSEVVQVCGHREGLVMGFPTEENRAVFFSLLG